MKNPFHGCGLFCHNNIACRFSSYSLIVKHWRCFSSSLGARKGYSEIMKDYEEAIAFLGEWGRFQQIMFFLLCSCIIPNGIINFSSVFLADSPRHSCLIPNVNLTQDWLNATIPNEVHLWMERERKFKDKAKVNEHKTHLHFSLLKFAGA